jgi:tetrahydromethanopterin S-methyltransferase subunit G
VATKVAAPPKAAPPPVAAPPKAAAPPPPPVAAAPVIAPAPVKPVMPAGPTPEQIKNLCRQMIAEENRDLSKQVIELTIKVSKMDNIRERMDQIEQKLDQIAASVQSSPKAVKAMGAKMDELYGLLQGMQMQPHQSTDEERIHDQFHCVKCRSEKLVAIHVKCTSCGTENWMGWFPDSRKAIEPGDGGIEHY